MAKKYEYIKAKMETVKKLVKSGDISTKVLDDYRIYQMYRGYSGVKSKMERYQFTADDARTSVQKVMRAIKNMESSM